MKKRRIETVLVGVAVLSLAAGLATGLLVSRLPGRAARASPPSAQRTPLAEALDLTPEQTERIRAIWGSAM